MQFLIRTIDLTATGREIVRERAIETGRLTIGRAAENVIHLADLAVEQHHAVIESDPGGPLHAHALGTLGFAYNGRVVGEAVIDPQEGAELGFGSYRLTISQVAGGPITFTQRQEAGAKDAANSGEGFALAHALPSKRVMSWTLLGAILVAFLAVPIFSHLTRERVEPDYKSDGQVTMDAAWSTGKLSLAHHGLEDNCEACHVDAFVAVRDETCLACHKDTHDHALVSRQNTGRGPLPIGERMQWALATTLGKEGPGACTTCHSEHEGATRMAPPAQAFCAECHNGMDARLTDTKLGNASDFGDDHPEFQPLIWTERNQREPRRVSLSKKPREFHGLAFPHDTHLDPQGGVARMAASLGPHRGYGEQLVCKDCHVPERGGTSFKPVEMEQACEACHSLVYDKVGPTFRTLRHGDVAQMLADLRAMDRAPRAPVVRGRARPGQFAKGRLYFSDFGRPGGSLVAINRAMMKGGVCGDCHTPTMRDGKPDVVPVNLPEQFLVHANFDHEPHEEEKCETCHAATKSDAAADLLIPGIAICRDCHLGEDARKAEVPSPCAMCHTYHPIPLDKPRKDRPKVHDVTVPKRLAPESCRMGDPYPC